MKTESMAKENFIKDGYLLEGMTCDECERKIISTLNNLEGVQSAEADLSSSAVSFDYDPGAVAIDKIRTTLKDLGYKMVDTKPPEGKGDQRDGCCS